MTNTSSMTLAGPCGTCGGFSVVANLTSDAQGCHWDITYQHSYCDANTNQYGFLWNYPHGIRVTVAGATITSVVFNPGGWSPVITQNPSSVAGATQVTWSRPPILSTNVQYQCDGTPATNAIPSGNVIQVRVYVTSSTGSQSLTVTELGYAPPPNENPLCASTTVAVAPALAFQIQPDQGSICSGTATLLHLVPPPPSGASIVWYRHTPLAGQACPFPDPPASVWTAIQSGGTTCPTNQLFSSTCYAAIVNTGCFSYVARGMVKVCAPLTSVGGITSTPASGVLPLQTVAGLPGYHACGSWNGTLSIAYGLASCPTTLKWETSVDGGPWTVVAPLGTPNTISTGPLTSPNAPACSRKYSYRVTLTNACATQGTVIGPFDIYLDRPLAAAEIQLSGAAWIPGAFVGTPLGPVCNKQSVVIRATGKCGRIVGWQQSTVGSGGPWTSIAGGTGAGSADYFTNNLLNASPAVKSWWYRVQMQNGACPAVWSAPYEVKVKPTLAVALTANKDRLCPPPALLTAVANTPGVSYEWFRDGVSIAGQTASTLSVSVPGNYYVEVRDSQCQTKARSNVVRICGAPLVAIAGPCGICKGASIQLTALAVGTPAGCAEACTFSWSGPQGFVASTSVVTVTIPGTYTVTATCGICVAKASHTVVQCP